jgi:hypothetical protein
MASRGPAKFWTIALLSAASGVAGWFSRDLAVASPAPAANSATHSPVPAPLASAAPASPISGQADHRDPAAFSKRDAFDRLFAKFGPYLSGNTSQTNARFVSELFAELQDLDSSQFPFAIADVLRRSRFDHDEIAGWIASYWAERDLDAARSWLMQSKVNDGDFEQAILESWAHQDAAGMFDWFQAHLAEIPAHRKNALVSTLAILAAERDPERGLRLMSSLDPGRCNVIYFRWAQHSPEAAAARALRETDEARRNNAVKFVAFQWAHRDGGIEPAIAWAEKIPDPALSNHALLHLSGAIVQRDPAAGANHLLRLPPTNDARQALQGAVLEWCKKGWHEAARWTLQLDDDGVSRWLLPKIAAAKNAERIPELIQTLPEEKREAATRRWEAAATSKPSVPPSAK